MTLTPIGDRVLVLLDVPEDMTESGLIVVSTDDPVVISGTVAVIGPGPRCEDCGGAMRSDLKVGERVCFAPNQGSEATYDGVTYLVLTQDEILGIVEDE